MASRVLFGLAGCLVGAGATICLRKSHVEALNERDNAPEQLLIKSNENWYLHFKGFSSSQLWAIGMFLSVAVSPVFSALALVLIPACLVCVLSSVTLLLNFLLAWIFLGESMSTSEIVGGICVATGAALVVGGAGESQVITVPLFVASFERQSAQLFCGILLISIVLSVSLGKCLLYRLVTVKTVAADPLIGDKTGSGLRSPESTAALSIEPSEPTSSNVFLIYLTERIVAGVVRSQVLIWATISGLCCGSTTLAGKALLIALTAMATAFTQESESPFSTICIILFAAALLLGLNAFGDLFFMNKALRNTKAILVAPFRTFTTLLTGVLGGMWVFDEVPRSLTCFVIGLLSSLVGVGCFAIPFFASSI